MRNDTQKWKFVTTGKDWTLAARNEWHFMKLANRAKWMASASLRKAADKTCTPVGAASFRTKVESE